MRVMCCLILLLPACATRHVQCDGRLQPINHAATADADRTAPRSLP